MRNYADWLVGSVAIVLGLATLWFSARGDERLFTLPKVRFFAEIYGKLAMRCMIAALGLLLVAAGVAVALGFTVKW